MTVSKSVQVHFIELITESLVLVPVLFLCILVIIDLLVLTYIDEHETAKLAKKDNFAFLSNGSSNYIVPDPGGDGFYIKAYNKIRKIDASFNTIWENTEAHGKVIYCDTNNIYLLQDDITATSPKKLILKYKSLDAKTGRDVFSVDLNYASPYWKEFYGMSNNQFYFFTYQIEGIGKKRIWCKRFGTYNH